VTEITDYEFEESLSLMSTVCSNIFVKKKQINKNLKAKKNRTG
jgi:hypothetical protein